MSSPIRQLVYGSSSPGLLSRDSLLDILRASRRNNPAVGVTGALLYADGNFMQVLEGPAEAVDGVYRRVQRDPRHRGVLTLIDTTAGERSFPDWSMGFVHGDDLSDEDRQSTRSLHDLTEPSPGAARRLLATFRSLMPGVRVAARA